MKLAYGGAVVNAQGQVVLRRVANNFGGYVWSWPMGRPDHGESPEKTALPVVLEETGYTNKITSQLPGRFVGGLTANIMYLMRPLGAPGPFCWESSEIRWIDSEEAPALINQTTHKTGRDRGLVILAVSIKAMKRATT